MSRMLPLTAASVDSINNESGAPKVTVWALVNTIGSLCPDRGLEVWKCKCGQVPVDDGVDCL